jgi:hypothetical protein
MSELLTWVVLLNHPERPYSRSFVGVCAQLLRNPQISRLAQNLHTVSAAAGTTSDQPLFLA